MRIFYLIFCLLAFLAIVYTYSLAHERCTSKFHPAKPTNSIDEEVLEYFHEHWKWKFGPIVDKNGQRISPPQRPSA